MHNSSPVTTQCSTDGSIMRRMRVSVIREEFLELTGHAYKAILLNQLYYWTQKVKDFDEMLLEEKNRDPDNEKELRHGWIYKSAPDFLKETLLRVSKFTFYRHMNYLIEKGWVETKGHPTHAWDKTTFYRLNLEAIHRDLNVLGYELPAVFQETYQKMTETFMLHNETSMLQNATYNKTTDKNKQDIDKDILLKHCFKERRVRVDARDKDNIKESQGKKLVLDIKSLIKTWNDLILPDDILLEEREDWLLDVVSEFFHESPTEWYMFCQKIKETPSLLVKKDDKQIVCLNWISKRENVLKIINGFREMDKLPPPILRKKDEELQEVALGHIDTIKDPIWKKICKEAFLNWAPESHYSFSSPNFSAQMKRNGQNRNDIETFLKVKLWEAKLGTIQDKVTLIYIPDGIPYNQASNYKFPYHRAIETILFHFHPDIKRLNDTRDIKIFDDHCKFYEGTDGEKRRDV